MLFINYKGTIPQQRNYSYAVKGNNKSNIIKFMVERYQEDLDLRDFNCYLKLENKEAGYYDKIKLENVVSSSDFLTIAWEMTRKSTHYRNLDIQLQFESNDEDDIVFQTLIASLEFNGNISVDKEISEEYPSVLEDLEKKVDKLEEDVGEKVDKTHSASKVYGTDENGNQTTYDKEDFGKVDDVKVNGVSVVSDKVANIDLSGKVDKVNSAKKFYGTNADGEQTTYNEEDYAKLLGRLPSFSQSLTNVKLVEFITSNNLSGKYFIGEIIGSYYLINITLTGVVRASWLLTYLNGRSRYQGSGNIDENTKFSDCLTNYTTDEITDNKTTSISQSSTDTQYPSAKAVYDLVQAIKRNAFTPVDITEYPTLADFLASTGEEGYLYLYPVDTSDLTKGYKQYIWESNQWVYMGDTQLDLTNYYTKGETEQIIANSKQIKIDDPDDYLNDNGLDKIIREEETDGSVKSSFMVDKIYHQSTLEQVLPTYEENGLEIGEDIDIDDELDHEEMNTMFGNNFYYDELERLNTLYYNQNNVETVGILFGNSNSYGAIPLVDCIPNKVVRVIVGRYFEYDQNGNKVFDEHCAIYSDCFAKNPEIETREITEEKQVFELKTCYDGRLYFDSDGAELGYNDTRFIFYGFATGKEAHYEYSKRPIENNIGEVEIEKVWLTYDDKKSIRSDYLGLKYNNASFINDSTRIWYNFKTSPISSKVEEEIEKGRFVIRLDYPSRNKSRFGRANEVCQNQPQAKNGVGTRTFALSFIGKGQNYMSNNKRAILLRSLIFITKDDIKVNRYGEKYIHKKVSFFDYINKTCSCVDSSQILYDNFAPLTNESINVVPSADNDIFEDYLLDGFSIGIPAINQYGSEYDENGGSHILTGRKLNRFYQGISIYSGSYNQQIIESPIRTNSGKLNPAFSCYSVIKWVDDVGTIIIYSPYYIGEKSQSFMSGDTQYYITLHSNEKLGKTKTRKMYMSARPRCAILNDNYEASDFAFLKTFKQSDQQIKLMCKAMIDLGEFGIEALPIFRTIITQK